VTTCTPLPGSALRYRQRGDQGLALAGAHLGDLALVQHHAADQLHVEVAHAEHARAASRTVAKASGLPERPEKHDLPAAALGAFRELENTLPDGELKDAVERLLARRHAA
jgi:hypothetical protein